MQAARGRCCHTPFQVCSITLILFSPFARILIAHLKQLKILRKFFDSRPNFDPRMALEGPTGDFAGESPEAPNAHLTSLPNAKKDMFNVGRCQCLEKRNTGVPAQQQHTHKHAHTHTHTHTHTNCTQTHTRTNTHSTQTHTLTHTRTHAQHTDN